MPILLPQVTGKFTHTGTIFLPPCNTGQIAEKFSNQILSVHQQEQGLVGFYTSIRYGNWVRGEENERDAISLIGLVRMLQDSFIYDVDEFIICKLV